MLDIQAMKDEFDKHCKVIAAHVPMQNQEIVNSLTFLVKMAGLGARFRCFMQQEQQFILNDVYGEDK